MRVRVGSTPSRPQWTSRELVAILGPDAATAASLSGRRQREYVTSRAMVRTIVRDELRQPWHGFEIVARGEKPRLRRSSLDVSMAHSGDRIVVGVVPSGRIGVDIEEVTAVFDQPSLIRRLCTPAEQATLAGLPAAARRAWLTQLWSTKEAFAKALGIGLALDFTGVDAAALTRRTDVRDLLAPATGDARIKMALVWVDEAPRDQGPRPPR